MSEKYQVSSSPHVRAKDSTSRIMLYVILALLPASLFGIWNFGLRALMLILVTIASCVVSEWAFDKIVHKKNSLPDLSAVVTGLLLALNLPASLPWWEAVIGGVFAIVIVKMLFGGLGQNFMNPAMGARCFLLISFTGRMTDFATGKGIIPIVTKASEATDALSGATPLAWLKTGTTFDLKSMFFGNTAGCIGETSALALLAGGLFLVAVRIIRLRIPGTYLGTFALLTLVTALIRGYHDPLIYTLEQLCAGGLMLGAWFMATDYVTSPITGRGQLVFGTLLGILTWLFRLIGTSVEGVSYSIIFCNLLVPMIEHYTRPVAAGVAKQSREAKRLMREKAREARRLKAADRKEKSV